MKKDKKDKKERTPGSLAGIIISIIVIIAILFGVFAWMYSVDLLFLPDFVEDFLGLSDDDSAVEWNMGELQSAVKNGKSEQGTVVSYEATYNNVIKAFLDTERPEGEYAESYVTYHTDSGTNTRRVCIYRYGDSYRAEQYGFGNEASPEVVTVKNGNSVSRLDCRSGEITKLPYVEGISFENDVGIPSVDDVMRAVEKFPENREDVFENDDEAQSGAGEDESKSPSASTFALSDPEEITDCDIKLVRYYDENVYYICFVWADTGIKEEYYLSLDYRTVVGMYAEKDGGRFFSYEVKRLSFDSETYRSTSRYVLS